MKNIIKYNIFNENTISYKYLPVSTIVENIQIVYDYEGEDSMVVEMDDSGQIKHFQLTIKKFNPYSPNSTYTKVGRALKILDNYGLLYSNMNFCIMFNLEDHKIYSDKFYTSAVGGYKYKYDNIIEIIEHFKEYYTIKPKNIELKVGDFILNVKDDHIYRVATINRSDYIIFDIATQAGVNHLFPESLDKDMINNDTNGVDYKILSKEKVENKIDYIDQEEMVKELVNSGVYISGVRNGEEYKYWDSIEISSLIESFNRIINKKYFIYRVFKNNKKIYDPMGDFVISGHKKVYF